MRVGKKLDQLDCLLEIQKSQAAQRESDLRPPSVRAQDLSDALLTCRQLKDDLSESRQRVRELQRSIKEQNLSVARLRLEAEQSWYRNGIPVLHVKETEQSPIYPDFFGSPKFSLSLVNGSVFGGRNLNWRGTLDHDGNNPHMKGDLLTPVYNALTRLQLSVYQEHMNRHDDDIAIVAKHFGLAQLCSKLVWRGEVYDLSK